MKTKTEPIKHLITDFATKAEDTKLAFLYLATILVKEKPSDKMTAGFDRYVADFGKRNGVKMVDLKTVFSGKESKSDHNWWQKLFDELKENYRTVKALEQMDPP